jgi:type III secretion protein J
VAVLLSAGIKAEKQSQDGRFSISTSQGNFVAAVRALNVQGYPRDTFDSMGKIFKREGFVSSPLEERARLSHAMSQEIANTLANIDGVITARVHLVMPEINPLIDKPQPSAASVFIKHRPDRNLQSQVTQIKALVVNSIEGLKYGNVTVALFPAEGMPRELPVPAAKNAGQEARQPKETTSLAGVPMMAGGFGMIGAVSLGAGLLLSWRRRAMNAK